MDQQGGHNMCLKLLYDRDAFFILPTETLSIASQALVCKGRIIQDGKAGIEGSTFDFALRTEEQARPLGLRAWVGSLYQILFKINVTHAPRRFVSE